MASIVNDLCRLCAKKHAFLKDLLDENNKTIMDLIRNFTQINVSTYFYENFKLLTERVPLTAYFVVKNIPYCVKI